MKLIHKINYLKFTVKQTLKSLYRNKLTSFIPFVIVLFITAFLLVLINFLTPVVPFVYSLI